MESDAVFFTRRAREEVLAASKADHPRARQAHLQMAARYADLARAIDGGVCPRDVDPDESAGRVGIWF
jgi:hypothetical protein